MSDSTLTPDEMQKRINAMQAEVLRRVELLGRAYTSWETMMRSSDK